jgi:putative flippase GtrA
VDGAPTIVAEQKDFRTRLDGRVDRAMPRALHPYREQVLFLVIGGWNTVFGYLVFAGLYWALNDSLPVTVVLVFSWVIAVANAYVCYRYLVFRSRGRMHREIPRFFLVYGVTLVANIIVLPLALRTLSLNAYVVQGLFTLAVVLVSYFGHRWFSFREGRGAAGSAGGAPNASDTPAAPQADSRDPED